MAPVAPTASKPPSASALRRQRITGQIHPLLPSKVFRAGAAVSDDFLESKRDKRRIRHSVFLSRVQSSADRISKSGHRRRSRRPANKLASLDSLADALPNADDDEDGDGLGAAPRDGKVRHKSLRSRKGALKRKERVVKGEMERFGASMAKLSEAPAANPTAAALASSASATASAAASTEQNMVTEQAQPETSGRWAALRGYISATMEQNPAFANKS